MVNSVQVSILWLLDSTGHQVVGVGEMAYYVLLLVAESQASSAPGAAASWLGYVANVYMFKYWKIMLPMFICSSTGK